MIKTMKRKRHKVIISGYLLLVQNNNILLSRRFQTGYEDGKYSVPAGHMEENETITQGTLREIKEEIGILIKVEDLLLVHIMHRKSEEERIDFFFSATKWKGSIVNKEPEKCDDLQFFPLNQLPLNTVAYIKYAIECFQKSILYSEYGW